MVQLSHLYVTTGKTTALTRWTFVSNVMSLLFNTLSRIVIGFISRNKCLNFLAAVTIHNDFGAKKIVCHCFHCFPIYLLWSDGTECHIFLFVCCCCCCFECRVFHSFTLLFHLHQEALYFLFSFCHEGGVICISELLIFLLAVLIPACSSPSPAFCVMYSAYKLNKQGDNI